MLAKIKNNKSAFVVCILYFVFSLIQSSCLVFGGDDLWWAHLSSPAELFGEQNMNGRYVTNLLTFIITHSFLLRALCGTFLLTGLFLLMAVMLRRKGVDSFWAVLFSAAANFSLPKSIAYLTTNWISGITNYVLSIFLTFLFLFICYEILYDGKFKKSQLLGVLTLVLGFVSAFCLENVTIYNAVMALFFIIFYAVKYKKVHFTHIGYFIGTAGGLLVMLINKNYSSIIGENEDAIGRRFVEFGFSDIINSLYAEVIPYFAKIYYPLHLCIALCLTVLFYKKFGSLKNADKHPYAKYCLVCVMAFAVYSFLIMDKTDLSVLNMNYRIRAIETAFVFLYIISAVYLAYCVLSKDSFLRFTFYICSAIMVTAPFLVVNPVTPRCFFATFIFWCMAAGEVFIVMIQTFNVNKNEMIERVSICTIAGFTVYFAYIDISNKLVDNMRNKYIVEQIESKSKIVEIVKIPYQDYAVDSTYNILTEEDEVEFSFDDRFMGYKLLLMDYLGLDMEIDEIDSHKYLEISTIDYYSTHTAEE